MTRRLPPLNGLKAFETAARSESFTRAAQELNVTQGAVSQQVKRLEATLGLKLFRRERQRLILTEAGRNYLVVIRDALDQIAVGTQRLLQRQESGVLTISTSADFAAKWLVNRLSRFAERHPDVDLRVFGHGALCRFCAGRRRYRDPTWRRELAGPRCAAALFGASVSGLQPQARRRT